MTRATILFLPGNMCDARLWQPVRERLAGVPHAMIVGDLAGPATIAGMADALAVAHAGPLILIGFSMGAIVAATLALAEPARVSGLGLFAFNASADLPQRAAVRPRQQQAVRDGRLGAIVADELKPNYLAAANSSDVGLRDDLMTMALDLGADVFLAQSEALRTRADLRSDLARIAVPVLLATGAEDRLCPPAWHCAWADAIGPNATCSIVEGAGHMLPMEQPGCTAALIAAWLEKEAL